MFIHDFVTLYYVPTVTKSSELIDRRWNINFHIYRTRKISQNQRPFHCLFEYQMHKTIIVFQFYLKYFMICSEHTIRNWLVLRFASSWHLFSPVYHSLCSPPWHILFVVLVFIEPLGQRDTSRVIIIKHNLCTGHFQI